jgi:nucleoside phosphorylase/predicted NACHT family NTPase
LYIEEHTMTRADYGWRRFWSPPTAGITITAEGYLEDPDQRWLGSSPNPDARTLDTLAERPCLVLLGEPGMGKSRELARHAAEERTAGGQVLELHLHDYQSDTALREDLLRHPDILAWSAGSAALTLYLDGLDEGLLAIRQLATLLPSLLRRLPIERLRLRIACRTAEWPKVLEEGLEKLWGEERVGVYELLPLRRADALVAARARGFADADAVLEEVARRGLGPLAIKPVTLDLLLNLYARDGSFPETQADLYRRGCELLCTETDDARIAAGHTGALSPPQRLALAGRIAAATIFGGRAAIWTGPDVGDVPRSDVTIAELGGGQEWADGAIFAVDDAALWDVLGTGLFNARGGGRLGWAHQTYAEFLAAWYLVSNGVPVGEILGLLLHEDGRVIPQLREVAARAASLEPEIFRTLIGADPLVVLRGDVASATPQDRADLVDALLAAFDAGTLFDRDWGLRQHYGKLDHPGLADQLRPYIVQQERRPTARRVAADIAEACDCRTVQEELAGVALDEAEPIPIRMNAALAVARIGDRDTRARLGPLAVGTIADDVDDELKGAALTAVWPDLLSAEALFAAITAPRNETLYGNYEAFLTRQLASKLDPEDLPLALHWAGQRPARYGDLFSFRRVADSIVDTAWQHLDTPGVLPALAALARTRLLRHEPIAGDGSDDSFRQALASGDAKRRELLVMVLLLLDDPDQQSVLLIYSETPLAREADLPWMVERLRAANSDDIRHRWSVIIARLFSCLPWTADRVNMVLEVADDFESLKVELAWLLTPVRLGSPEAARQKERYEIQTGRNRRERPLLVPSPEERVAALLERCAAGDADAWWRLNRVLTLEPDSTHCGSEFKTDLTATPGWAQADDGTRARIIAAAKWYLRYGDPDLAAWIGKNVLSFRAAGGYRALRLLLHEEPGYLADLAPALWERWAPIVLGFPVSTGDDTGGEEAQEDLLTLAYRDAPAQVIATLDALIAQREAEGHDLAILHKVAPLWDARLQGHLEAWLERGALGAERLGTLLDVLLDHGSRAARNHAEAVLDTPTDGPEGPVDYQFHAALALLLHTPDAGWASVCPIMEHDVKLGRRLVEFLSSHDDRHSSTVASRLTEEQLASLYEWLVEQYPPDDDPEPSRQAQFTSVMPRASVVFWRDGIITTLKERGTEDACAELARLTDKYPEREWLRWTLDEARAIVRQEAWRPQDPRSVIHMAEDGRRRLERQRAGMEEGEKAVRRAVILTALDLEFSAVKAHLQNLREETHPQGTVYEIGTFEDGTQPWEVLIVEIGEGNDNAAQAAERAINYFQPTAAFFVGVAGGVKDVDLGDVVAASKVYGYESGKDYETGFAPRPDVGESSYSLEQRARAERRRENWHARIIGGVTGERPRAFIGPIAAGEKVVASDRAATAQFIKKYYGDTLAVEMEGRGFLRATRANEHVAALVVRGISDLLSGKADADAAGGQGQAARNASAFAFEILAQYG